MESQLAFLAICLASAASPGPGGLAVVSNSINHNLRRTLPVIFGIATGLLLASLLANTWLLAVIHSSELAFQVMTWLCSGYIAYLGRTCVRDSGHNRRSGRAWRRRHFAQSRPVR